MGNKTILFDVATASDNLGDAIIMDYCKKQIRDITVLPSFFVCIPTYLEMGKTARCMCKNNPNAKFVCGTNLLKSTMLIHKLWHIGLKDAAVIKNVCLMGVGWINYQNKLMDPLTKLMWLTLLRKNTKYMHSVRDKYTENRLRDMGIDNVIYTGCPTMWNLTPEKLSTIPTEKGKDCITTLTFYNRNVDQDRAMIEICKANYRTVYFWIQSNEDLKYLKSLTDTDTIKIIGPSLEEYDDTLRELESVDYIGTRLHGGVRALNFGRRAIIVGIDNRATEISNDTGLLVIKRENVTGHLSEMVNANLSYTINLPWDNISKWKKQFFDISK